MDFCPLSDVTQFGYQSTMAKTFRQAFLKALEESGFSVAEVARRSGVSKDQLNKLKQRDTAKTNVDDALKVAAVFGVTLEEFVNDQSVKEAADLSELLNQLAPEERLFLLNAAKAQIAARASQLEESPEDAE